MNLLDLQALPNQSFSIVLNNNRYDITIHEASGIMAATIKRNGVEIITGQRITAGTFLLPYTYLEDGNFLLSNQNDDVIYYTAFGQSQFLYYLSPNDLAQLRLEV